jgi:hypothetical protein
MLMEWAEKDPVSQKEIDRNNAVYSIQANRNPFIDYPGLERFIWGDMTDVVFQYDHADMAYYTGIKALNNAVSQKTEIYGVGGQRRHRLSPGINIIRKPNGRSRKVVVKRKQAK